ncbi:MAG: DUF2461 domain-containing protein [Huintestinicola sp.]
MPFSPKTLDFLFENKLHDSKEWYHEHKAIHREYVTEPFAELIEKLAPTMAEIDEKIVCSPKKLSRIYRDTRFSKDKSTFRDNVWCTLSRPRLNGELPGFYIDLSAEGLFYGCGYYCAPKEVMEEIRSMILSGDKAFVKAKRTLDGQSIFALGGDSYKRNHYPNQSPELCDWLNRKSIYAYCLSKDFDMIFGAGLADKLSEEFSKLKPFYDFLIRANDAAEAKKYHK